VQPWAYRSLVRVKLETGRKHQIRAHFASRKTPIVGDPLYGPDPEPVSPLLLAATELSFDHPATNERMTFRMDTPAEILEIFPKEEETPTGDSGVSPV
jgi:23S rRNA pseudouridine1911/1915/1917 synthase